MKEGATLVRGRPAIFHPLFQALAPDWLYTPAMIADLAELHGFLALLKEGGTSRFRVRSTLTRYPQVRGWPKGEDPKVHIGPRDFQGWYGWRWQRQPDLAAGLARRAVWVDAVASAWPSEQPLSLSQLGSMLQRSGQADYESKVVPVGHAGAISARICKCWVMQRVLAQGLDPSGLVSLADWREPLTQEWRPHSGAALFKIVQKRRVWAIHDLIAQAMEEGILTEEEVRAWRAGLYDLLRRRYYPETGDEQFPVGEYWLPYWHRLSLGQVLNPGAQGARGETDETSRHDHKNSEEVK